METTRITSVEEEEEFDLPYLVEERTVATQKSLSFQLAPWVDDRLRIFEAEVTSPKNLGLWNGLGVVGTVEFLYMLIMQETSLLPMLATGAIGFYGLSIGSRLLRRSAADRLISVDLHRDGKYVDLIIEGRRGKKTVKDLPIESFKVHTEFKNIEANRGNLKQLAKLIGVKNNITVQDLQKSGLAELGSFATYNDNYVFIPVNHEANKAHIGNLFHGKTIAIAGQTPKTA